MTICEKRGKCSEPKLHRTKSDFNWCVGCRKYAVLWWLVCLKVWVCEDCNTYNFGAKSRYAYQD